MLVPARANGDYVFLDAVQAVPAVVRHSDVDCV